MQITEQLIELYNREIKQAQSEIKNNSLWELGAKSQAESDMFRQNIEHLAAYIAVLRELSETGEITISTDNTIDRWLSSMFRREIASVGSHCQQIVNEHNEVVQYLQTLEITQHEISASRRKNERNYKC